MPFCLIALVTEHLELDIIHTLHGTPHLLLFLGAVDLDNVLVVHLLYLDVIACLDQVVLKVVHYEVNGDFILLITDV